MWEWEESGFGYPGTKDQPKICNPSSAQHMWHIPYHFIWITRDK